MKNFTSLSMAARKRGISLIEAVLYLVIALAVIVGGIVFFQQAQLSNQVTDTARASVGISSQTRALYQNQRTFGASGDDLSAALLKSGAVPNTFIGGTAVLPVISHPFGGDITVSAEDTQFVMTFAGMSAAACTRLATVSSTGDGPLGTGIATVAITNSNDASLLTASKPVSAADAAVCIDDANVIVTFDR
jgi:Tfp pilus assembly protein PilV